MKISLQILPFDSERKNWNTETRNDRLFYTLHLINYLLNFDFKVTRDKNPYAMRICNLFQGNIV